MRKVLWPSYTSRSLYSHSSSIDLHIKRSTSGRESTTISLPESVKFFCFLFCYFFAKGKEERTGMFLLRFRRISSSRGHRSDAENIHKSIDHLKAYYTELYRERVIRFSYIILFIYTNSICRVKAKRPITKSINKRIYNNSSRLIIVMIFFFFF